MGVGLGLGNNRETIENNALMASSDQPVLLFSACNIEAGHKTTDYGDSSLNVACTCTMHCSEIKISITD